MEDMTIIYPGRYGERIEVEHLPEGGYLISCEEIGLEKTAFTAEEFEAFEKRYCNEGVSDFDKSDLKHKESRAIEMGKRLQRYHRRYQSYLALGEKAPLECLLYATDIYRLMMDVKVLELTDEQYEKWFVRAGWEDTDEEYMQFILNVKKHVVD